LPELLEGEDEDFCRHILKIAEAETAQKKAPKKRHSNSKRATHLRSE
jgi:hypothetical protein